MRMGLGVAALVIVGVSFFVPFLGPYMNFVGLLLATAAVAFGERSLTIAVVAISVPKLLFMSLSWLAMMHAQGNDWVKVFTWIMLALPVVVLVWRHLATNGASANTAKVD